MRESRTNETMRKPPDTQVLMVKTKKQEVLRKYRDYILYLLRSYSLLYFRDSLCLSVCIIIFT